MDYEALLLDPSTSTLALLDGAYAATLVESPRIALAFIAKARVKVAEDGLLATSKKKPAKRKSRRTRK